jgi:DNA-binding LytR/AlgR family response regulator
MTHERELHLPSLLVLSAVASTYSSLSFLDLAMSEMYGLEAAGALRYMLPDATFVSAYRLQQS